MLELQEYPETSNWKPFNHWAKVSSLVKELLENLHQDPHKLPATFSSAVEINRFQVPHRIYTLLINKFTSTPELIDAQIVTPIDVKHIDDYLASQYIPLLIHLAENYWLEVSQKYLQWIINHVYRIQNTNEDQEEFPDNDNIFEFMQSMRDYSRTLYLWKDSSVIVSEFEKCINEFNSLWDILYLLEKASRAKWATDIKSILIEALLHQRRWGISVREMIKYFINSFQENDIKSASRYLDIVLRLTIDNLETCELFDVDEKETKAHPYTQTEIISLIQNIQTRGPIPSLKIDITQDSNSEIFVINKIHLCIILFELWENFRKYWVVGSAKTQISFQYWRIIITTQNTINPNVKRVQPWEDKTLSKEEIEKWICKVEETSGQGLQSHILQIVKKYWWRIIPKSENWVFYLTIEIPKTNFTKVLGGIKPHLN